MSYISIPKIENKTLYGTKFNMVKSRSCIDLFGDDDDSNDNDNRNTVDDDYYNTHDNENCDLYNSRQHYNQIDPAESAARMEKFHSIGYHQGYNTTMDAIDNDDDNNNNNNNNNNNIYHQNGFEYGYIQGYDISTKIGTILGQQIASNIALQDIFGTRNNFMIHSEQSSTTNNYKNTIKNNINEQKQQKETTETNTFTKYVTDNILLHNDTVDNNLTDTTFTCTNNKNQLGLIVRNGLLDILVTEPDILNGNEKIIDISSITNLNLNENDTHMLSKTNIIHTKLEKLFQQVQCNAIINKKKEDIQLTA